jgi:hypothetical protein
MTHNETLEALEDFRKTMEQLSRRYPEDRDFWAAYADLANELEAGAPRDFRDYVRNSILRTMETISHARDRMDSTGEFSS